MKKIKGLYAILLGFSISVNTNAQTMTTQANEALEYAKSQLTKSVQSVSNATKHPRRNYQSKTWEAMSRTDWTSGFWSGCLWLMYESTNSNTWLSNAKKWSADLESNKNVTTTHDIGFQMMCSYGNGDRLSPTEEYKDILITAAQSLSSRFDAKAGAIISWDKASWHPFNKPVIIDNMMNLELLFYATAISGDSSYYKLAVQHADKTLETHQREDGSFYHIVDYDDFGNITFKGFKMSVELSPEKTWSRGQGWGLYGYTMCYRFTKNPKYLAAAEKSAQYIAEHLPKDFVPYFMYDYPENTNRDASAGAIAFSSLIELYNQTKDMQYLTLAENILTGYTSTCLTKDKGYYAVLCRATEDYTDTEKGVIYADYYFIEGLIRYLNLPTNAVNECTLRHTDLHLYPNPATTSINIEVNALSLVRIINLTGKTLITKIVEKGNNNIPINLDPGTYLLHITTGNKNLIQKLNVVPV